MCKSASCDCVCHCDVDANSPKRALQCTMATDTQRLSAIEHALYAHRFEGASASVTLQEIQHVLNTTTLLFARGTSLDSTDPPSLPPPRPRARCVAFGACKAGLVCPLKHTEEEMRLFGLRVKYNAYMVKINVCPSQHCRQTRGYWDCVYVHFAKGACASDGWCTWCNRVGHLAKYCTWRPKDTVLPHARRSL
jgi:hypothetical protein